MYRDYSHLLTSDMQREVDVCSKAKLPDVKKFYQDEFKRPARQGELDWIRSLHYDGTLQENSSIIDIGGGLGWFSVQLAKVCNNVMMTDIADFVFPFVEKLRQLKDVSLSYALVPAQNVHEAFGKESYDVAFLVATAHHCKDLDKVYKSISKILKPGGRLYVISEPIVGWINDNDEIKNVKEKGCQDNPYMIFDYAYPARKYFTVKYYPAKSFSYYVDNRHLIKSTFRRTMLFLCSPLLRIRFLYMAVAEIFGHLPVDFVMMKETQGGD